MNRLFLDFGFKLPAWDIRNKYFEILRFFTL